MLQTDGKLQQLKDDEAQPHNQEMTSKTSHQLLKSVVDKICDAYERYPGDAADYLKTGFSELDANHLGLAKGSLTLLAGDANSGKTTLLCNIASNIAIEQQKSVGVMTFRHSAEQLVTRILASIARIPMKIMHTGEINDPYWKKLLGGISRFEKANMQFAEPIFSNVEQLLSNIESMITKYQLEVLAIDDFPFRFCSHDLHSSMHTAERFVEELRQLARRLNIPIILTAGISHELHRRLNRRPNLADLAIQGNIALAVDNVLFLYADGLSHPSKEDKYVELRFAKNANGPLDSILLRDYRWYSRFEDYNFMS